MEKQKLITYEETTIFHKETTDGSTFYAACEFGHDYWTGPERSSYQAARQDALAHDNSVHNGESHAGVLP